MNDYSTVISAINFVNSAFLLTLGLIIIIAGLLIVNNLIMRFYIPMGIIKFIRTNILDVGTVPPPKQEPVDKKEPTVL